MNPDDLAKNTPRIMELYAKIELYKPSLKALPYMEELNKILPENCKIPQKEFDDLKAIPPKDWEDQK